MTFLERHNAEENVHRFYVIDINQDLFGRWLLERRWGRVKHKGSQSIAMSFESEAEAVAEQAEWQRAKMKRGYAKSYDQEGL